MLAMCQENRENKRDQHGLTHQITKHTLYSVISGHIWNGESTCWADRAGLVSNADLTGMEFIYLTATTEIWEGTEGPRERHFGIICDINSGIRLVTN